jgi:hypothetical protein
VHCAFFNNLGSAELFENCPDFGMNKIIHTRRLLRYDPRFHKKKNPKKIHPKTISQKSSKQQFQKQIPKNISKNQKTFMPKLIRM